MKRIIGIDITRGIAMMVMALDHVRDFMHKTSVIQDPTDLKTTSAILFLTRWITHLCAPTFVFLAGTSAYLSLHRSKNISDSRKFLLKRGLLFVVLEFVLINFVLWFDIHFRLLLIEVIAAIGLSFIVLSFLIKLPSRTIGIIGLVLIISGCFVQHIATPSDPAGDFIFSALFRPNLIPVTHGISLYTAYPLIPWLGIMLIGFAAGELFEMEPGKRKRLFMKAGIIILAAFFFLRLIDLFGDPTKWSRQKSILFTLFSFLNVTKYPPSLLFTILFTGITLILLSVTESKENKFTKIIATYGRVPFFYFVVHLFVIHLLMFLMLIIQGYGKSSFMFGAFKNGRPETGGGVNLLLIYAIWIVLVAAMYPVCKWYDKIKTTRRDIKFLRYI